MIIELKDHWYEIFLHLGFSYEQLAPIKEKYPLSPEVAMAEAVDLWTKGDIVSPSWESLVTVLRYKLLENDVANRIEKAHCLPWGSSSTTNNKCELFVHFRIK